MGFTVLVIWCFSDLVFDGFRVLECWRFGYLGFGIFYRVIKVWICGPIVIKYSCFSGVGVFRDVTCFSDLVLQYFTVLSFYCFGVQMLSSAKTSIFLYCVQYFQTCNRRETSFKTPEGQASLPDGRRFEILNWTEKIRKTDILDEFITNIRHEVSTRYVLISFFLFYSEIHFFNLVS